MRFGSTRLLNHGLTALVGVIAGVCYERSNGFSAMLPGTVLHATALGKPEQLKPYLTPIQTDPRNRTVTIMRHGFPSFENVRNFNNFVVGFDRRTRNPNWVIEHLNEHTLTNKTGKLVSRVGMEFFSDQNIHPFFRTTNEDFFHSGYDRGHLAAAGNHPLTPEDMSRTFVLSNISPQVGIGFNRHIWNVLEVYTRYRAKRSKNLWVCTGPLFLAKREENGKNYVKYEVIGNAQIAVPTHFFKVLLIENLDGTWEFENYLMENTRLREETPLRNFQVPLDVIERAAGFLIFDGIANKEKLPQNQPNNKYLADFKFRKRDPTTGKLEPISPPPNKMPKLQQPIAPAA